MVRDVSIVNCAVPSQFPGSDMVLYLCKMLPLGDAR